MKLRLVVGFLLGVICLFALITSTNAMPILRGTFIEGKWVLENTDGEGVLREAEATFEFDSGELIIILENTAPLTKTPHQMLAGIFFDYSGILSGAPSVSADEGDVETSKDISGITSGDWVNLNSEYGYLTNAGLVNFTGADYIVSATSLDPEPDPSPDGWPGISDTIEPSIFLPDPPDGADWALVGASTGMSSAIPEDYVQSEIKISWNLEGDPGDISNVWFIYGTDYTVPEPATMLLVGSGLIFLAPFRRKFRK